MSILVLADLHEGQLAGATAHVVAAAQAIGGDIDILVAGEGVQAAAETAAKLDGVSRVRVADNAVYAHQLAEPMGALLVELAGDYTHVLASASTTGKNVLPRLAALKDVSQLSDVIGVESADTFLRPIYAGNAIATVKSEDELKVITIRTTVWRHHLPKHRVVGMTAPVINNGLTLSFWNTIQISDQFFNGNIFQPGAFKRGV